MKKKLWTLGLILLIVINVFLLIVGCLVDLTPAVIMLTPILLPSEITSLVWTLMALERFSSSTYTALIS